MAQVRPRAGSVSRLATPLRVWLQRFAFLLLIASAVGLMILSEAESSLAQRLRTSVTDAFAPILAALSSPAATVSEWAQAAREFSALREENERLSQEVARLGKWEAVARRLNAQNAAFRDLLHAVPEGETVLITARVIADTRGSFVKSVLVNAGASAGIREGLAVLNTEGLVGRVADVGQRSARVLLLTDLNSRVPVVIEATRERAILAGDNSDRPWLRYLSAKAPINPGDRVVTSGHGGVFPPGLPVGVVSGIEGTRVRVQPYVNWTRMEYVRIADHAVSGLVVPSGETSESGEAAR